MDAPGELGDACTEAQVARLGHLRDAVEARLSAYKQACRLRLALPNPSASDFDLFD